MRKKVWIFNHYAGNMVFDKGGRHYWFAKYLKRKGYDPVVFVSNTRHGIKEQWIDSNSLWVEKKAEEINTPFIFVKSSLYEGNGKDRIKNMLGFFFNLKKAAIDYSKHNQKPEIIIASSVHPFTMVAGIQLAKRFNIPCICEVRDLWPESLVAYGVASENSFAVRLLRKLEKWIYKRADAIIFTMEGAYEYIRNQGWEADIPVSKVFYINNGVDLEEFYNNATVNTVDDKDLQNEKLFKIVYAGSLRKANNIGRLLDAAKQTHNSSVRFMIWGTGEELDFLKDRAEKEKIHNVDFKGKVDKKYVPYIIMHANANFLDPFDNSVAQYGISSNKLFEYFAAGKPIIMNDMHSFIPGGESDCKLYYLNDVESIVSAVNKLTEMDEEQYKKICKQARAIAEEYSFDRLTSSLIQIIEKNY